MPFVHIRSLPPKADFDQWAAAREVSAALARDAGVAEDRVFASFRPARSGEVFDGGEIVHS